MAAALPAAKLREFWDSLPAQLGVLKSLGTPVVKAEEGVENAWVPATFEIAVVWLRMYFDAEGRLAGLRVMPGPPPADWSPAPYADPARVREREVTVGSGAWALPGTLTLPAEQSGLSPALVLVHGSGPHDRDESVGGTKVFRDLAGGLAARGVVVLRYEKRTKAHGARMQDHPVTVREEVVDDALAAIALLRAQPEVDGKRVAVLGHSLGGMLAPRIAADDPVLAGLVILAGNTRPLDVLASEQVDYLVSVGAATKAQADALNAEMAKVRAIDPAKPPLPGDSLPRRPGGVLARARGLRPGGNGEEAGDPGPRTAGGTRLPGDDPRLRRVEDRPRRRPSRIAPRLPEAEPPPRRGGGPVDARGVRAPGTRFRGRREGDCGLDAGAQGAATPVSDPGLVFKALADPTRRRILEYLREGDLNAGEIAERFDMTKPSISHHLSLLKQARLVQDVRRGQNIVYSLDTTVFQEALRFLLGMTERKKKSHERS
ncbi:MAG: autorepressor SdpR family transcription factor [Holophagales bacterium]|nr:autorepressor SdpR family transcription factor [Holophagales bacterium]